MAFIHESPLKSHGNLRSSNCLVDIRWTVKVADFGLSNMRVQLLDEKAADLNAMYKDMYWTAPEILRDHKPHPDGTQLGDIYSFSMVLYEILFEKEPYENEHPQGTFTVLILGDIFQELLPIFSVSETSPEICHQVIKFVFFTEVIAIIRSRVDPPYRPKLSESKYQFSINCSLFSEKLNTFLIFVLFLATNLPFGFMNLIRECWSDDASHRPSFNKIRSRCKDYCGGK